MPRLPTKLDWLEVEHWNTDNPHIHIIVRGKSSMAEVAKGNPVNPNRYFFRVYMTQL